MPAQQAAVTADSIASAVEAFKDIGGEQNAEVLSSLLARALLRQNHPQLLQQKDGKRGWYQAGVQAFRVQCKGITAARVRVGRVCLLQGFQSCSRMVDRTAHGRAWRGDVKT